MSGKCVMTTDSSDATMCTAQLGANYCSNFNETNCHTNETQLPDGSAQCCFWESGPPGNSDGHHVALYIISILALVGVIVVGGLLYKNSK